VKVLNNSLFAREVNAKLTFYTVFSGVDLVVGKSHHSRSKDLYTERRVCASFDISFSTTTTRAKVDLFSSL